MAYTAPHWPLQVPDDWIDKYAGRYDAGWQSLKTERIARQQALGLFDDPPDGAPLAGVAEWDTLPQDEQAIRAKEMEIYAAMVEYMDWQIGLLVDRVDALPGDRPTLIMFMSDNGPEGNAIDRIGKNGEWVAATFNNDVDNMGKRDSYLRYSGNHSGCRRRFSSRSNVQGTRYFADRWSLRHADYHRDCTDHP